MPSEVILPRVDMDMTTGKISKWLVENGAVVTRGQPLFEIETDKAAMEIEAPESGVIRDLTAASGTDIPVGSVVAWIDKAGETAPADRPAQSSEVRATATDRPDAETVVPDGAQPPSLRDRSSDAVEASPDRTAGPRATPLARRLARTNGLDLAALQGTGPRGRIQSRDIPVAAPGPAATSQKGAIEPAVAPTPMAVASRPPAPAEPARTGTTQAGSGPLAIMQLRDGTGTPTLLVHGFGADADNWRPLLSGRTAGGPVYALDLPGHGGSPLGSVASFADLVDALEDGLRARDLGAVDLVGHSLGGGLAAALAARGTLDVHSLLLLSPGGLGPEINGAFVRGFLGATSEASLTPWMHELVVDPAVITPAFVRSTLKARERSSLVASQRQVAAAVFPDDTQSFSIRACLAQLNMPTRIVFGAADRIIPAKQAAGLPGHVALHVLGNVGHMPHIEARDLIVRLLGETARR